MKIHDVFVLLMILKTFTFGLAVAFNMLNVHSYDPHG